MRYPAIKEDGPGALVCLVLLTGCGDSGGDTASNSDSITTVTPSTGCVGAMCTTTAPPTTGDDTTGAEATTTGMTGAMTTGGPETSSSSEDVTTGPPPACPFTPGCHKPGPLPPGVGLASEVPLGCDGGPFQATTSTGVGAGQIADPEAPRSIPMLADFDADGDLDLFLNMRKAGAAFVFRGNGDGTFDMQSPATLTGGLFAGGWGGDTADFNGDGTLDVLVGDHVRGAYAWTGGPNLAFAPAITGLPPMSELWSGGGLADFDGDGAFDAVFGSDQFGTGYGMVKGDGAGGWTMTAAPTTTEASNVGHFQFADYDADGALDIFAFGEGNATALSVYVYRNDGVGGFTEVAMIVAGGPDQINADPVQGSIGDINCDGSIDIAAGGSIYLGMGGGWALQASVDGSHISHLADMNGDGHLDIVTQDPTVGVMMYTGDGTGTTWTPAANGLPDAAYTYGGAAIDTVYGIDVGDVNGNEVLDVVRVAGFGAEFAIEVWTR